MTTEIKYKDVEDAAYEEAQKLAPDATHSSAGATVSRPGAYDKSIVAAVNALCDVICAEDVNVGETADDALEFLGALLLDSPVVKPDLGTKSITENGTYDPADDELDGYSEVTVEIEPNLGSKSITENGTYDPADDGVDGYSSVTVNVSGGGEDVTMYVFPGTSTVTLEINGEPVTLVDSTDVPNAKEFMAPIGTLVSCTTTGNEPSVSIWPSLQELIDDGDPTTYYTAFEGTDLVIPVLPLTSIGF